MAEMKSLAERRRLRSMYRGLYVAWIGNKIVAHGKDLRRVVEEARKHGDHPLIDKVEKKGVRVV